jgi:hypothetical protein
MSPLSNCLDHSNKNLVHFFYPSLFPSSFPTSSLPFTPLPTSPPLYSWKTNYQKMLGQYLKICNNSFFHILPNVTFPFFFLFSAECSTMQPRKHYCTKTVVRTINRMMHQDNAPSHISFLPGNF